jgi:hypothetical protein
VEARNYLPAQAGKLVNYFFKITSLSVLVRPGAISVLNVAAKDALFEAIEEIVVFAFLIRSLLI